MNSLCACRLLPFLLYLKAASKPWPLLWSALLVAWLTNLRVEGVDRPAKREAVDDARVDRREV
jgi:hypothetical protein